MSEQDGRSVLGGLPISNNLQKSGDNNNKVDRQNSFVLYGAHKSARSGTMTFGHKISAQHQQV